MTAIEAPEILPDEVQAIVDAAAKLNSQQRLALKRGINDGGSATGGGAAARMGRNHQTQGINDHSVDHRQAGVPHHHA